MMSANEIQLAKSEADPHGSEFGRQTFCNILDITLVTKTSRYPRSAIALIMLWRIVDELTE